MCPRVLTGGPDFGNTAHVIEVSRRCSKDAKNRGIRRGFESLGMRSLLRQEVFLTDRAGRLLDTGRGLQRKLGCAVHLIDVVAELDDPVGG
ncbi:hypothetical protein RHAB21_01464 [Pseudorhizobium halotolerans]|uniref:Uncharacterized protein n=1 Tax=Pseudorhizobium halotolerans TaxID=1233081 RepID=A0ABN7JH78_9HYPH|nr:hypothetical protein RHAB21_01464 [Pseudorhizobium halotolerans]